MPDDDQPTASTATDPEPLPQGLRPHKHDRGLDLTLNSDNGAAPREVEIREPSITKLGKVQTILADTDDKSPKVPELASDGSNAREFDAAMTARRKWIYGGTNGKSFPYGSALIKIIKLCDPSVEVTLDDLPSWCAGPAACQAVLNHFTTPLVGTVGPAA